MSEHFQTLGCQFISPSLQLQCSAQIIHSPGNRTNVLLYS